MTVDQLFAALKAHYVRDDDVLDGLCVTDPAAPLYVVRNPDTMHVTVRDEALCVTVGRQPERPMRPDLGPVCQVGKLRRLLARAGVRPSDPVRHIALGMGDVVAQITSDQAGVTVLGYWATLHLRKSPLPNSYPLN